MEITGLLVFLVTRIKELRLMESLPAKRAFLVGVLGPVIVNDTLSRYHVQYACIE